MCSISETFVSSTEARRARLHDISTPPPRDFSLLSQRKILKFSRPNLEDAKIEFNQVSVNITMSHVINEVDSRRI